MFEKIYIVHTYFEHAKELSKHHQFPSKLNIETFQVIEPISKKSLAIQFIELSL
jgi:hypothetical protein